MVTLKHPSWPKARILRYAICIALAAVCVSIEMFDPVDRIQQMLRDKFRSQDVSGSIVIVTLPESGAEAHLDGLALELIERAGQLGVERIAFSEVAASKMSGVETEILQATGPLPEIAFGVAAPETLHDSKLLAPLRSGGPVKRVVDSLDIKYWLGADLQKLAYEIDGKVYPSMSSFLAGAKTESTRSFPIDYALNVASIPTVSVEHLLDSTAVGSHYAGTSMLVDFTSSSRAHLHAAPGQGLASSAKITVLAAESLLDGEQYKIGPWPFFLTSLLLLFCFRSVRNLRHRVAAFVVFQIVLFVSSVQSRNFGIEMDLADGSLVLWIGFATTLIRDLIWRSRMRHETNPISGLRTPNALKATLPYSARPIVAARVHGYSEIASKLTLDQHRAFSSQIAKRLAPEGRTEIFQGDDGLFFWLHDDVDTTVFDSHLSGLASLFRSSFDLGTLRVSATAVFGVDLEYVDLFETRISHAAASSQRARQAGEDWQIYSPVGHSDFTDGSFLAGELETACHKGEIQVFFQPKLDLLSGQITSAEALCRWTHPIWGPVPPDRFIPVAEAHGLIEPLTLHVLTLACLAQRAFAAKGHDIKIAVNISPVLLSDESFFDKFHSTILKCGGCPEQLIVEITESRPITGAKHARKFLLAVRDVGVEVSIDDYGTGASTLDQLKQIPAQELKIDRAFAADALTNPIATIMLRSTVQLAHSLGMRCVIEGVENAAVIELVRSLGSDIAQGYGIAKPLPATEFEAFLRSRGETSSQIERVA